MMTRPDKHAYLKYGINAGITMDQMDKYIDQVEKQNTEMYEALKTIKEMNWNITAENVNSIVSLLKEIES